MPHKKDSLQQRRPMRCVWIRTLVLMMVNAAGGCADAPPAAQPQPPPPQPVVLRRPVPPVLNLIVVDAGPDRWSYSDDIVRLDGSSTRYGGRGELRFHWEQIAGPVIELRDSHKIQSRFKAPSVTDEDDVLLRLTVEDGLHAHADELRVRIIEPGKPHAHIEARPGVEIVSGQTVTLDAGGSAAATGRNLAFTWTQIGGPSVALSDPSATAVSFVAPGVSDSDTVLTFRVMVSEGPRVSRETIAIRISGIFVAVATNDPADESPTAPILPPQDPVSPGDDTTPPPSDDEPTLPPGIPPPDDENPTDDPGNDGPGDSPPTDPAVTSVSFIDASLDIPLEGYAPLTSGADIDQHVAATTNIQAAVSGQPIERVEFSLQRAGLLIHAQTERQAPYTLFGDADGDYDSWPEGGPQPGNYTLEVTPYASAEGAPGSSLTVTFDVLAQDTCVTASDCDDGTFCNGSESCVAGVCAGGPAPCPGNGWCVESTASCQTGNWNPPIGVPHPGFGVEAVAPPYDPGNPLHYYVDNTHAAAGDTDNPTGSPQAPRLTVPADLPAGAVVEVRGGPYAYNNVTNKLVFSGQGTVEAPIFIRGPSSGQRPLFIEEVFFEGQHIIVEQLVFDDIGFDIRPVIGPLDHITVRFCEFVGSGLPGRGGLIKLRGEPTPVRDIVLFGNTIFDNGDDSVTADDDGAHGIEVGHGVERVWILENTIRDNNADSVQVNFWGTVPNKTPARAIYIGRNTMHGDRENAVDVKVAYDVVISENTIFDYIPSLTSNGEAIVIHRGQTTSEHSRPEHIWVLFNEIHDSEWGVSVTSGVDIFTVGNLFRDNRHALAEYDPGNVFAGGTGYHARNCGPLHLVNNSFWHNDSHITLSSVQLAGAGNILDVLAEPAAFQLNVINGQGAVTLNQDTYYNGTSSVRILWDGAEHFSLADFQNDSGEEPAGSAADPDFADPANGDFQVLNTTGTPAADGSHPIFAAFEERFGFSIAPDVSGRTRRE